MAEQNYHESIKIKNTLILRERLKLLPPFLAEFFRGIADTTLIRTRMGYAYDLGIFFDFLTREGRFCGKTARELSLEDLREITIDDLEEYSEYLSYYINQDGSGREYERHNQERGKSRKLSALRTMFTYFYKKRKLDANPSELIGMPKARDKVIVRLEADETAKLLDEVESGENLPGRAKKFHELTKTRDLAIVTLLLGTGMRVSECVGINIEHVNFDISAVKVTRKGGNEALIYFGDEVEAALAAYLDLRENITAKPGHESALFISLRNSRITVRAVQNLVKKYSRLVTSYKNITPHKLRSTYGTSLYRETGDIYLVAEVLGHKDVNTTKKHYADMGEDMKRRAAGAVRLRD